MNLLEKKLFSVFLIIFIIFVASYDFFINTKDESINKIELPIQSSDSRFTAPKIKKKECTTQPNLSLIVEKINPQLDNFHFKVAEIKRNSLHNPSSLLSLVRDKFDIKQAELHSLALFDVANECRQVRNSNSTNHVNSFEAQKCNTLPVELIEKPLSALDIPISNGSALAKTYYLSHAFNLANSYLNTKDEESIAYSKDILIKAEKLGFEAATQGSSQANFIMSRAYSEGWFGSKDMVKAIAFLTSLEKHFKDGELKILLDEINAKSTSDEINKGRNMAYGCISEVGLNLANPFK